MLNIKNKILPIITAIVVVGGGTTFVVTAAQSLHPAASVGSTASSEISSTPTSSIVSSESSSKEVSTVDTDVAKINDATSKSLEKIDNATSSAVAKVQSVVETSSTATSKSPKSMPKFCIIDPSNGDLVAPGDKDYEAVKAQLGGDAGTVDSNRSSACRAALAKLKAASSTASK